MLSARAEHLEDMLPSMRELLQWHDNLQLSERFIEISILLLKHTIQKDYRNIVNLGAHIDLKDKAP